MALLRKKSSVNHLPELPLNITALMDILTVLLFFLIKSFSVSQSVLNTPEGIRLPASYQENAAEEAPSVAMGKDTLYFNNAPLIHLRNGRIPNEDLESDRRTIKPLKALLEREYNKRMSIYAGAGDTSFLPAAKVIIQADKNLEFGILKTLLFTVANSGYTDYEFVTHLNEAPSSKPKHE